MELSVSDVEVGSVVRWNDRARSDDIKNIDGEWTVTEVIPCHWQVMGLVGADGWVHLRQEGNAIEHQHVSLALLERVSAPDVVE